MNSLFNTLLKQTALARADLEKLSVSPSTSSPAALGQIAATLSSLARTLADYASLASREPVAAKAEKAQTRVKEFRAQLDALKAEFERVKAERDAEKASLQQTTVNRAELLGRRSHQASTPENPYAHSHSQPAQGSTNPLFAQRSGGGASQAYAGETMMAHSERESSFLRTSNAQLDEFLDRGRAVLGDLGQQREVLKGTQRRLYSVANTLGVSGDTIRMVERRARQDKWVFYGGVLVFFVFCWLVLRWLR
ncbi:MAG: protein transport protein bos1 [Trizodia sp. TS-e1964]|nr:MAG: protein transport protein bos1 [Trizodia sp. TS-e1964]